MSGTSSAEVPQRSACRVGGLPLRRSVGNVGFRAMPSYDDNVDVRYVLGPDAFLDETEQLRPLAGGDNTEGDWADERSDRNHLDGGSSWLKDKRREHLSRGDEWRKRLYGAMRHCHQCHRRGPFRGKMDQLNVSTRGLAACSGQSLEVSQRLLNIAVPVREQCKIVLGLFESPIKL